MSGTPAVPAVVVGGEINGLGIVRSLAAAHVPTVVLDTDLSRPTMRTRHAEKRQVRAVAGEAFLDELDRLRQSFAVNPVLFLTQEKSVATVAENYDRVAQQYRIAMPPAQIMRILMDKSEFQSLAEQFGFPIPRAVRLKDVNDLDAAAGLTYPCVLKPIVKSSEYDLRFKKAYKVADFPAAAALFAEIKEFAVLILQEWIEGGDDAIYFCLQYRSRDQRPIASFAGRKLRSWPPRIGGTASCLAAPEAAPELERLTNGFFTKIGFFGMGSMEYKKDARTGRFVMIEPTVGRTDFQEEVATLNGVNIPLAAYAHEAHCPIGTIAAPSHPGAWVVSPIDRWSRDLQPDNRASIPSGVRRYDAIRRLNDPMPWLYVLLERLRDRVELLKRRRG